MLIRTKGRARGHNQRRHFAEEKNFVARKDESILNLLVESPWWVGVLVSVAAFVFLRYILPSIDFGSMAALGATPFVALVLFIPAPIAALNSWYKRKHRTGKE